MTQIVVIPPTQDAVSDVDVVHQLPLRLIGADISLSHDGLSGEETVPVTFLSGETWMPVKDGAGPALLSEAVPGLGFPDGHRYRVSKPETAAPVGIYCTVIDR